MKIGIPRSLYYYYYKDLWLNFFEELGIEVVVSPKTNKEILDLGLNKSIDEMCLSLKNYIGHVLYLENKCDYILIPRIDNYGVDNQTCTNFLATFDILNNMINTEILNYNIDIKNRITEEKELMRIGILLGKSKTEIRKSYNNALQKSNLIKDTKVASNINKLKSNKIKILILGHPYNIYDELIGKPICDYLLKNNIELIYSDLFDSEITNQLSKKLSSELYFKYNKENIGCIPLVEDKIGGIIFISSFPCGPDSLVNELVIRKINKPYLNLIIDDIDADAGLITRLESFIDILEVKNGKDSSISSNGKL